MTLKAGTRVKFTEGMQLDARMNLTGQTVRCAADHPCYGTVVGMARRRGQEIGYIVKTEFADYAQVDLDKVTEVS